MNPMVQGILGSLVRFALGGVSAYLLERGVLNDGQVEYLITAIVVGLGTVGWAVARKYWDRQKLVTALALPATTEIRVVEAIAAGQAASVRTPEHVKPQTGTGA